MACQCKKLMAALLVTGALAGSAMSADITQAMAQIAQQHANSLAVFRGTVTNEFGKGEVAGPAVCISTEPAVFISLALDARVRPENLSDFRLTPAGQGGAEIKAELLGIDPEMNVTFIKAVDPHPWTAVQFARASSLAYGQPVVSIGLWPADTGYQTYLGLGYVGSFLRVPEQQVYVTGGNLTNVGTPVFNLDGVAIGIVGAQRFMNYQTMLNGQATNLGLKSQQQGLFFLPVEEFVHMLENIPASPTQVRRLAWLGVLDLSTVSKEIADVMKLDRPGVMIDQVVPNQAADKAGLQNRDVIVAVNGQPLEKLATSDLTTLNLDRKMTRFRPGQQITLTVVRGQETREATVTLDPFPMREEEAARHLDRKLGMLLREKIPMDQYLRLSASANVPGLVVALVAQDGPASKGGVQPYDLIAAVNNQPVQSIDGYKQIEPTLPADQPINFLIRRGDMDMTVTVQPAAPPAGGQ